ncbi:N-acetylmannosaminyltransferase [hydrothermal vent metagenome]|uniref:N-acetylmannosaminyltransferase n=1 Tax=hydrothermal vent metagenome TaxID=652676 RepID=A0A3B1D7G5_9ZZZZ
MDHKDSISFKTVNILGVRIAAINLGKAVTQILKWIESDAKTYICVTGVHGIIESQSDLNLKKIHNLAGMCVPDGMPTVWVGRLSKHKEMGRVYGPDLMLEIISRSVAKGYTHFFYGGREGVPELLKDKLQVRFPELKVVGTYSPPFRPLNENEENELKDKIESLAPDIIWVGLSTPKQEKWMAEHLRQLNTKVMIGVGAAFDFHAGLLEQAPPRIQRAGLEWFYRLCVEPRRLWRRYFYIVPTFLFLIFCQFTGLKQYNLE